MQQREDGRKTYVKIKKNENEFGFEAKSNKSNE